MQPLSKTKSRLWSAPRLIAMALCLGISSQPGLIRAQDTPQVPGHSQDQKKSKPEKAPPLQAKKIYKHLETITSNELQKLLRSKEKKMTFLTIWSPTSADSIQFLDEMDAAASELQGQAQFFKSTPEELKSIGFKAPAGQLPLVVAIYDGDAAVFSGTGMNRESLATMFARLLETISLIEQDKKNHPDQNLSTDGTLQRSPFIKSATDSNFAKEVLENPKLAAVFFAATWCPACRALAPELDAAADTLKGEVSFYTVDVDTNRDVSEIFGIKQIPSVLIFMNGNLIDTYSGDNDAGSLVKHLRALNQAQKQAPGFKAGDL